MFEPEQGDRSPEALRTRWAVVRGVLVALALLLALAAQASFAARGRPFAGVVTDPFGVVSNVRLPGWDSPQGVVRPDRVVAVDGVVVPTRMEHGRLPATVLAEALTAAVGRGSPTVTLTLQRGQVTRQVRASVQSLGRGELVAFFGLYVLMGLVLLWTSLGAYLVAERREPARAYALLGVSGFALLITFFDYHASATLWPVFALSAVGVPVGLLGLAWSYPTPPRAASHWGPRLRALVAVVAPLLVLVLLAGPVMGFDPLPPRHAMDALLGLSLLGLAASVVVRYRHATGHDRDALRLALWGLAAAPTLVGVALITARSTGVVLMHLLLPLVAFVVPLSIGWALVRHNILAARAVVTRRWLYVPTAAVGAVVALLGWLAFRNEGPTSMDAFSPVLASGGLFAAVLVLLRRLTGWALFSAEAEFRPTVEQLADSLARTRDEAELLDAIARNVTSWLPSGRIRLVAPHQVDEIDHLPDGARVALEAGHRVWTTQGPWERQLLVPMRSLGVLQRVLVIAPKRDRALFTKSDLSLLDTVAALGAQSLHNATMLRDLEDARRLERDASRGDKRATLGILGAELAHEIAHPLQLFRGLLRKASRGPLSADDIDVGGDELARLERLLANMRRLEAPPPRRESVALGPVVARAALLGRELREDRRQQLVLDLPDNVTVLGDADAMVQIFANLLRNAAEAAPVRGALGVIARREGAHVVVDVWDDGPGVPDDRVDSLFQRWVTTKDGGSGLGLAVASSLALSLGWRIVYVREDARTCFRLTAPADAAALSAPPSHPSE